MKAAKEPQAASEMTRLLNVQNGTKAKPIFSSEEMKRRQDNLRKYLAENEIDAALLTSYHNVNYYADFLYCYIGRKYGLVVTQNRVTLISAAIDGGQPYRRTFGDNISYTDWCKDNYFHAVQQLTKSVKRLGIEAGHGGLDGADDHDPGRRAGRRWLSGARHFGSNGSRRRKHYQVSLRAGAQYH